jgi:hypothetical protein
MDETTPILPSMGSEDLDVTASSQVIIRSGQDPAVRVRLHDRQFIDDDETAFAVDVDADGLTAHLGDVIIAVWNPPYLSDFMDGLAADFRGWSGERSWSTNHLKLIAVFHSGGHIELRWTLQPWISRPDSWKASVTTWVEGGQQLTDLAADIRAFLTHP